MISPSLDPRALRNALDDPRRVCRALGIDKGAQRQAGGGLLICCPWHQERTPSCSVRRGSDGTIAVKCHACGASGDVLTLIAHVRGLHVERDFPRVLEEAAALAGKFPEKGDAELPERQPPRDYPPIESVEALWRASIAVADDEGARDYLKGRAIDPAIVTELDLARVITRQTPLPRWASYRRRSWFENGHRILLPVFDSSGAMRSLRAWRIVDGNTPKRLPPAGHKMAGLVLADAAAHALLAGLSDNTPRIVVVEGEPDFLTWATRVRGDAVFGTGSGFWSDATAAKIPSGATVIIRTDHDAPGHKYAYEVASSLGGRCELLRSPEPTGKDVDENDRAKSGRIGDDPAADAIDIAKIRPAEEGQVPEDPEADDITEEEIDAIAASLEDERPLAPVVPLRPGAEPPATSWKEELKTELTRAGAVISPSLRNLLVILSGDERLANMLAYHDLRECVVKVRDIEWRSFEQLAPVDVEAQPNADEWSDVDDTLLASWLDGAYDVRFPVTHVRAAVNVVARRTRLNPIRDYLRSLSWDATPRLNRWLASYLGTVDTAYERAIGPRWMISAVARALTPGCKADYVLVLEGKQETGKSSALQILASLPWFSDDDLPIGATRAAENLHGTWIHEIGEIGKLNTRVLEQVKAFVVRRVDKYREAYGHRPQSFPRRCVFAGTSNDDQYLTDPTGGRRWWGVRCCATGPIDLEALRRDRDQLWAEAVVRFDQHESWHVDSDELRALCTEQQEARLITEPWAETIGAWVQSRVCKDRLYKPGYITTSEIMSLALEIPPERRDKSGATKVGNVLKRLGWRRDRYTVDGRQLWGYSPPDSLAIGADPPPSPPPPQSGIAFDDPPGYDASP